MKYRELLDKYKRELKAMGHRGRYDNYVKNFLKFTEEENINIFNIKLDDTNEFIITLKEKDLTPEGINNYVASIRNFYSFLLKHEYIEEETLRTIKKLKSLKTTRKIKDYITANELDEILEMGMTFHDNLMYPLKMKTILYFMYYTGVRLGELTNLKRKDFNLEEKTAVIKTPVKNYTEGLVFYTNKVKNLLEKYFESEPERKNAFNITRAELTYLLRQLDDFVPSGKHLTAHTFRHSFGMMLSRKVQDIRVAQKLMRHKNIQDTLIYYDPDIPTIKKIYEERINKKEIK